MPVSRKALCLVYALIAVLALVGCWANNIVNRLPDVLQKNRSAAERGRENRPISILPVRLIVLRHLCSPPAFLLSGKSALNSQKTYSSGPSCINLTASK